MTALVGSPRDLVVVAGVYASHPCLARTPSGTLFLIFARSGEPKGRFVHPPNDPRFVNVLARSSDAGNTWIDGPIVPGPEWTGVECSGITALADGALLVNQFRFGWLSVDEARAQWARGSTRPFIFDATGQRWRVVRERDDWDIHDLPVVRTDIGSFVHRSDDGGTTWTTTRLETDPFQGVFSPKGGIEFADGGIVLALGSHEHDPLASSLIVRSRDGGRTWSRAQPAAAEPGLVFSEPTIVAVDDERLLILSREEVTGYVYQSVSDDRGQSWGRPTRLPLWGYPSHAIRLRDGRILAVYGHRRRPYGVRGCLSVDGGRTWGEEFIIYRDVAESRDGLNLGYPTAVEIDDRQVLVAWYAEDKAGTVGIRGAEVEIAGRAGRGAVPIEGRWTHS